PGAEISLLRHSRARADFNFAKRISVRAIAETCAIVQRQIPRNLNPRALMDEWCALNPGVEDAEPEKPPLIERLRRPNAKNQPTKFPEHAHESLIPSPRRIVG